MNAHSSLPLFQQNGRHDVTNKPNYSKLKRTPLDLGVTILESFIKIDPVVLPYGSGQTDTQTHRHTDTHTHRHIHSHTHAKTNSSLDLIDIEKSNDGIQKSSFTVETKPF